MADIGRFGKASGSGRVDVKRMSVERGRRAFRLSQFRGRQARDGNVEPQKFVSTRTVLPIPDRFGNVLACGPQAGNQRSGDDDITWCDDIDGVRQCRAARVGVEQRHHHAGSRESEPDRQVVRTVRHQEANGITGSEAHFEGPARVTVDGVGQLAVAQ